MKTLLQRIGGSPVAYWNFAADGVWEESLHIPTNADSDDFKKLEDWVSGHSADVAFEAFFDGAGGGRFFLGMRIAAFEKNLQVDFLTQLIRSVPAGATFDEIVRKLSSILNFSLFAEQPDFLELGIVNAWKSIGALAVWRKGDKDALKIQDIESRAPQLLKPHGNAATLELAWKQPLPHWLGLPVAEKRGSAYKFDPSKYEALLGEATG